MILTLKIYKNFKDYFYGIRNK